MSRKDPHASTVIPPTPVRDYPARHLVEQALAAHQAGRLDEAERLYREAAQVDPTDHNALTNLGTVLLQTGRTEEGLEVIEASLAVKPDQPNAINNRGNAYLGREDFDKALADYDEVLAMDPYAVDAHSNRGAALRGLGRLEEAVASYERALELMGDHVDAVNGLGIAYEALGRPGDALPLYDRALKIAPHVWELYFNRGNALRAMNRPDEAEPAYRRALELSPGSPEGWSNLGVALQALGRYEEAQDCCDRAIALAPDNPHGNCNKAFLQLMRGDYAEGFKTFEWRWKHELFKDTVAPPRHLCWLGQHPIRGKRLHLICEQGLGDTLQMLRYAPMAVAQGAVVTVSVPDALVDLARSVPGISRVFAETEPVPPFDCWTALMSLPLAFGTTLQTVPSEVPYVAVPDEARRAWRQRLAELEGLRVGIAWSGRQAHQNDANRSLAASALAPLLEADARFVSVQNEYRESDQTFLRESVITDFAPELKSFSDTAGLVEALDLVVAVDTSVAHLAGALGKPVLILIPFVPDFRWGLEGETTPWYPTARILRQTARGDWGPVLAEARAHIDRMTR
jgi:tetratricopeptide (TPR) repeat protein